jgi:hypothetical protein
MFHATAQINKNSTIYSTFHADSNYQVKNCIILHVRIHSQLYDRIQIPCPAQLYDKHAHKTRWRPRLSSDFLRYYWMKIYREIIFR